ncbi:hypothetical protein ACFQ4K_28470 [Tistrella bauzanensis]
MNGIHDLGGIDGMGPVDGPGDVPPDVEKGSADVAG